MMEYLVDGSKDYHATVRLGVETDTYDVDGEVIEEHDASDIDLEAIQRALRPFEGMIEQVPPMFSALKKDGKRLYDMARAGIEVEREPRPVHVLGIDVVDWSSPDLIIDVTCGRGFYMRSLAHDLGEALGCGGHLRELTRTRNSAFHIDRGPLARRSRDLLLRRHVGRGNSLSRHRRPVYARNRRRQGCSRAGPQWTPPAWRPPNTVRKAR